MNPVADHQRLDRAAALARLMSERFDLLVVGGGASGLGVAVDAATRGWRVALVEAADFAQGTSSRSTQLVHGGVRYLRQRDWALVREALAERDRLRRNAPHLVRELPFVVPCYAGWELPYYGLGLKLYDGLAGRRQWARSRWLSRAATLAAVPTVARAGLRGGIRYSDGQFNDARLAVALAQTAAGHGAALANRVCVTGLRRDGGRLVGAHCVDRETDLAFDVQVRCVVNATGVWSDDLRRADDPAAPSRMAPTQGVHLVLPAVFAPSGAAILVPRTDDGRVLFVIPWHGRTLVGTTDTPAARAELEPVAQPNEIAFLLRHAACYLDPAPTRADILSVYAGLRPLVRIAGHTGPNRQFSRSHQVWISPSGLVTLAGGKWTTYRQMAEDALDAAIRAGLLPAAPCRTAQLPVHGALAPGDPAFPVEEWKHVYGTDAAALDRLMADQPALAAPLHPALSYPRVCAVWAARHEMARSVDDVLARRTRALLLDARAAAACAADVAALLARELGRDAAWAERETIRFQALARRYRPPG